MQSSWNQWGSGVNAGNYASNYPGAMPPTMNNFQSVPSSNQFPITATSTMNTSAAAPIQSQYPVGNVSNSMYGQPTQQQQQWQQWEQWQQQYAQWHQQYGDKYQGPMPTSGVMPTGANFSSMPPLPPNAPVQPPPPDSVPPPADKNGDSNKRPLQDSGGKDETKKLKLGKGSKSENVEDLIEQEKTFDGQFKSWETSFLKWKEQNANHPDKAQYKEYEAKWETWREQLLQKREQLRKKRENKEAEIAAAAAAAKEAALATSNATTQSNFNNSMMNTNNPYAGMYSMPGVYPPQDMMSNQSSGNYPTNYSMFNMPPPPTMPQMQGMPPMMQDSQNMPKLGEGPKSTQSLEFLSSTTTGGKSIPGLDLAGTDKNVQNSQFSSNVPPNSSLFSFNQDVTKPLHTSDDKPFNFPVPPSQSNFPANDGGARSYGRGRSGGFNSYDQYNKGSRFSRFDGPPSQGGPNQMDRNQPPFDDRFGNMNREADSNFSNDYKFGRGGRNSDYREEPPDKGPNKFGTSSYTPNLSSDKFAKYLEDEYDDSRFRDPEPSNENQQYNNKSNFQNRENNFGGGYNNRQNFGGRSDNSFGYGDRGRGGFNRSAPFDRNKPDGRFESFGRGMKNNQFGGRNNADEGFERGGSDFNRGASDFNRGGNDYNRGGNDFNRGGNDFNRGGNDFNRGGNDFNRGGNDFNRGGNDFNRGGNDFNRGGTDMNLGANSFNRESNDVGRTSSDSKLTEPIRPVSLLDLPPMKPPETFEKMNVPSEELDTSSKPENTSNSFPAKNNKFGFTRNESDQNFYSDKEAGAPPLKTKPPFNSGVKQDPPVTTIVNDPMPPPEVIQTFTASKIFEYDHISRTSDSTVGFFEPVYVFDYSHGKKKVNDFVPDSVTPLADLNNLNKVDKVDESSRTAGPWDGVEKKNEESVPLPPRTPKSRNSSLSDALNLFKNASDSQIEDTSNAKDSSRIDVSKPVVAEKTETTPGSNNARKEDDMFADDFEEKQTTKLINDILCPPGRHTRPLKLVIIMRGPPGSGKTHTAKLIKDKEVEMGGNAPRILSLDDYFTVENDVETTDPTTGKSITKKEMQYEYDADLEPSYQESLLKSFKKTVSDGFFPFIILDCVNHKVKNYEEMYNFAKSKGFQVFVCEMDLDIAVCKKRNVHNRAETDISKIISEWEKTPLSQTLLDVGSLFQTEVVAEVDTTDVEKSSVKSENADSKEQDENKEKEQPAVETESEKEAEESENANNKEGLASYMEVFCTSKWENVDNTEEKLDKLDGVSKKRASTSFKDWLQLPEESESDLSWYTSTSNAKTAGDPATNVPRKKRVRWADLEERVAQQKMRSIGFVVGQTDWKRMMDPSFGGNKLTQTKYFYK